MWHLLCGPVPCLDCWCPHDDPDRWVVIVAGTCDASCRGLMMVKGRVTSVPALQVCYCQVLPGQQLVQRQRQGQQQLLQLQRLL